MTFTVKDINALTATTSLDGGQKIATAVPTGIGDNHNLRKITKENFLVYDASSVPTRQTIVSSGRVLNVNGLTNFLEFLAGAGALTFRGSILGVSPDGLSIPARLSSDGTVQGVQLVLSNGTDTLVITNNVPGADGASFDEAGPIQSNPKTTATTPTTGSTVNIQAAQWRVHYFELVGTIAALTINMPATPVEGQRVTLYFKEAVTAITHGGGGENLEGALTTAAAGLGKTWIFNSSTSTWVPIG